MSAFHTITIYTRQLTFKKKDWFGVIILKVPVQSRWHYCCGPLARAPHSGGVLWHGQILMSQARGQKKKKTVAYYQSFEGQWTLREPHTPKPYLSKRAIPSTELLTYWLSENILYLKLSHALRFTLHFMPFSFEHIKSFPRIPWLFLDSGRDGDPVL